MSRKQNDQGTPLVVVSAIPRSWVLWRRRPDSNRGVGVLQTPALPLGYAAMERETGLEPATFSLARRRSTTELLPPARPTL
jgi:hypothetical protein